MKNALIGYTGFVGSTLLNSDWVFDDMFNSSNFTDMTGKIYETVVCAGFSAAKWIANKSPKKDIEAISRLLSVVKTIKAKRFILISTIDVYPNPVLVTEEQVPIRGVGEPYGKHRLEIENFVRNQFKCFQIVRLPALFGSGLRKNYIFDLITRDRVEYINPNSFLQWYPMSRFPGDLKLIANSDVPLINIAVEPVKTEDIVSTFFPDIKIVPKYSCPFYYDMRTINPHVLGGEGHYHFSADESLMAMKQYLALVASRGNKP